MQSVSSASSGRPGTTGGGTGGTTGGGTGGTGGGRGGQAPTPRTFYATNRGGGLYSEALSQWLGAVIAWLGYRLRLAPTVLTLMSLVLGLAAAVVVIVNAPGMAGGTVTPWIIGAVGLLGWQLAYAFDCADGQLARISGRVSPAGGRVDVLCDVAVQAGLVAAVGNVAVAYQPGTPTWLIAVFAATWMVNLVTSVMQSGSQAASMVSSRSPLVRLAKLSRDYGAVVLAIGAVLTVAPQWTVVVVWLFTVVNCLFLLASIAFSARSALR
jgi:phosphatidylglycerophosphate synthase